MKKISLIMVLVLLAFSLAGCGKPKPSSEALRKEAKELEALNAKTSGSGTQKNYQTPNRNRPIISTPDE